MTSDGESAAPRAAMRRQPTQASGRSTQWRLAAGVLLVGVVASVAGFFLYRDRDQNLRRIELERVGRRIRQATITSFRIPLEALLAVPAFFEVSGAVDRSEFRRFVGPALQRHEGIFAFQWFPWVEGRERGRFERDVRAEGLPRFEIQNVSASEGLVRAVESERYLPMLFAEPPNERVLGLNLLSDPERASAPLEAMDSDGLFSTGRSILVEDPTGGPVVFVYHRVRRVRDGEPGSSRGVVNVGIRIQAVMDRALEPYRNDEVEVLLAEESAAPGDQRLYARRLAAGPPIRERETSFRREFAFADRTWCLWVVPATGSSLASSIGPWIFLVLSLVASALLALGLLALTTILRLRRRVEVATRLGQYTLGRKLGQGGMGQVFEAKHFMLRRPTAVKLIHSARTDRLSKDRFELEVQHTSALTHPNTVRIYDYGRTADGVFYYAMEYLSGLPLDELVKRFGPLPEGRVIHFLRQACGSLHEAHLAGLIHRDIKPANLFICRLGAVDDVVKVLDFGLVLSVGDADRGAVSSPDSVTGTPAFMAPEAVESKRGVDARSDLYSLGAVAYFMLTGEHVFDGATPLAILLQHQNEAPIPPSQRLGRPLEPSLERLVLRCLAKRPADRPSSAAELARELDRCPDAAAWSSDQAEAWWRERPEAQQPVTPEPVDQRELTIAPETRGAG